MKQILLITSMYPANDVVVRNNTAVCHYFAKEWVAMGYNVRVIHLYNTYPRFFYPVIKALNNYLTDKTGIGIPTTIQKTTYTYQLDGIRVTRIPIMKYYPHGGFPDNSINRAAHQIDTIIKDECLTPDFILGHFVHPTIEVIAQLKKIYPSAITTTSLHGKITHLDKEISKSLPYIDMIGYRCFPIRDSFEALYGKHRGFTCFSGVPENYISQPRRFDDKISKFLYVGSFIERKHPTKLLKPINNVFRDSNYTITFIGDGNQKKQIERIALKQNIRDHVVILPRLQRDKVVQAMDNADIFIMISQQETFGLVYLEAMSRGCIVIASRNEGMQGIIEHGTNGFLCDAGNEKELEKIVRHICELNSEQLNEISQNAVATASKMTDRQTAADYINAIDCCK